MSDGLRIVLSGFGTVALFGLAFFYFWVIGKVSSGSKNSLGLGGPPDRTTLDKVRTFLDGLASSLGPGKSYVDTNENTVEWRGAIRGHAVRIQVYWQYDVKIYVKGPGGIGDFPTLWWDESKVPQAGAPPAWDSTDSQLVFVGKGVYVEGSARDTSRYLAEFRRLPVEVGHALVESMPREGIERVYFDSDNVEADFKEHLYKITDPGDRLVRMVQTLASVVDAIEQAVGSAAQASSSSSGYAVQAVPAPTPVEKITCPYCGSIYLLTPVGPGHHSYGCPNCGAPPQQAASA